MSAAGDQSWKEYQAEVAAAWEAKDRREAVHLARAESAIGPAAHARRPISTQNAARMEMKPFRFADRPMLQHSTFHLLTGAKEAGKGTWLAFTAARCSRGEFGERRRVLWLGSEDSYEQDVLPRYVAAGGVREFLETVTLDDDEGWIVLPEDIAGLTDLMQAFGDVGLLIIDPLSNHIGAVKDSSDTLIRNAISRLNKVADVNETMVIGVRHLSEKGSAATILAAVLGSSAWVQTPRVVLAMIHDDEQENVTHLQLIRGNRVPRGSEPRAFRIDGVLLEGLPEEVTRMTQLDGQGRDVESIYSGNPAPSSSREARELILTKLEGEPGRAMKSDDLDDFVVERTRLKRKTVQNIRSELARHEPRKERLIENKAVRDEAGEIKHWMVARTSVPLPSRDLDNPHPDSGNAPAQNGLATPVPPPPPHTQLVGIWRYGRESRSRLCVHGHWVGIRAGRGRLLGFENQEA